MTPTIKKIIIVAVIAVILILVYFFFIKKGPDVASLTSSANPASPVGTTADQNSLIGRDFLVLLLNVKSINLDVSIFSDPAFLSLHDSTIVITPDGTEGRPNPFAPLGSEAAALAIPGTNSLTPPPSGAGAGVPVLNPNIPVIEPPTATH